MLTIFHRFLSRLHYPWVDQHTQTSRRTGVQRNSRLPASGSQSPLWLPSPSHRLRSSHCLAHVGRVSFRRSNRHLLLDGDICHPSNRVVVIGSIFDGLHFRHYLASLAKGNPMGIRRRGRLTQASTTIADPWFVLGLFVKEMKRLRLELLYP